MKNHLFDLGRDVLAASGHRRDITKRARVAILAYSELALEISLATIDEVVENAKDRPGTKKKLCRDLRLLTRQLANAKARATAAP